MLAPFRAKAEKPGSANLHRRRHESATHRSSVTHSSKRRLIMAVNLVALATQFLTPDMMARIASALGLDPSAAQKAIGGSIPAILAGMAGIASKPGGPQQLSNAVAQQPPGILRSEEHTSELQSLR